MAHSRVLFTFGNYLSGNHSNALDAVAAAMADKRRGLVLGEVLLVDIAENPNDLLSMSQLRAAVFAHSNAIAPRYRRRPEQTQSATQDSGP